MRFRIYMALAIVALAALLMGPLQQWPASTIIFSDGDILQNRYDDKCVQAVMQGSPPSNQITSTVANDQYVPFIYSNAFQSVVENAEGCWTEAATGNIEYIYNCGDGISREFTLIWVSSAIALSGEMTVRTFFGRHAGGAVVDGDEDGRTINTVSIPNFNFKSLVVISVLTLDEGDQIAVGVKEPAGAPDNIALIGWQLTARSSSCYPDSPT